MSRTRGRNSLLKGVGFFSRGWKAGGTPAFPALRVLGVRASRSHRSRNALLSGSMGRRACKKPTPLREFPPRVRGGLGWGQRHLKPARTEYGTYPYPVAEGVRQSSPNAPRRRSVEYHRTPCPVSPTRAVLAGKKRKSSYYLWRRASICSASASRASMVLSR